MTGSCEQLLLDLTLGGAKSLDTYVAGPNAEALDAVRNAARVAAFAAIWVHGPPASGKTHLLQGACRAAAERGLRAAYLPGALAVREAEGALDALAGLGGCALVAVDDLEAWLEVAGSSEALLGVYQVLLQGSGTLLVTSSARPSEVPIALADLGSRLRAATTYRLCELDDGEKAQVLQNMAAERGLSVSFEVVRYLLRHGPRDTPALLEGLARLERAAASDQRRLTIPLLKQVLGL